MPIQNLSYENGRITGEIPFGCDSVVVGGSAEEFFEVYNKLGVLLQKHLHDGGELPDSIHSYLPK